MEASFFFSLSSSKPLPHPLHSHSHLLSPFPKNPLLTPKPYLTSPLSPKPSSYSIRTAVGSTKKEQTMDTVKKHLETSYLVAGIKYKGLTEKQFQELRSSLSESTNLLLAKNTLVGKEVKGTPWEALKPCLNGMNGWLFVHSEEIPAAIYPYRNFQREKKLEENDFTSAVFEGRFYGPGDFNALETMLTRAEGYATLLGSLKRPATESLGTIQAPARDLVMVLKAYVKKLEESAEQ